MTTIKGNRSATAVPSVQTETFGSLFAAGHWLHERGYERGWSQSYAAPIGVGKAGRAIDRWRLLTDEDKALLYGTLSWAGTKGQRSLVLRLYDRPGLITGDPDGDVTV